MKFHKDGTLPQNGEVFVFGSNLAGIHGGGAALVAKQKFGALQGFGSGPMSSCYAIPTKDAKVANSLPLELIKGCVQEFLAYAKLYSGAEFFVTRIGCVLAGYSDAEIAPMFAGATSNCSFSEQWREYILPTNNNGLSLLVGDTCNSAVGDKLTYTSGEPAHTMGGQKVYSVFNEQGQISERNAND